MLENILLITDLDGTCLPSSKIISDENKQAINYWRSLGGRFSIATGRTIQSAKRYWDELEITDPVILYNGSAIYDPEHQKFIYTKPLPSIAKDVVIDVQKNISDVGIEILCTDGTYVVQNNFYEKQHIEYCQVSPVYCDIYNMPDKDWLKVLFAVSPYEMSDLISFIQSKGWEDICFVQSTASYYEMSSLNITKGSALDIYRKRFCKPEDKIISVGDYDNDIELLQNADYGVAPANAQDSVKQVADYVLQNSCDNNAIAELISRILSEFKSMEGPKWI
ncbi:MAG: Cof-type HAD-IIB family hydrolase [Ruminococcus sp.]|nr:Cof-type HAD-IIB family hydrolase [Ruminococcus sp.]